ncbi:transcription antitermination factor NusB, partial [Patescibacteria group bacterium]|nr:transcription antitermination factor NusB [Patescibacteria group bacterium]
RKLALLKFYSEFFGKNGQIPDEVVKELPGTAEADLKLLADLVDGVRASQTKIDELIRESAPEWPLERITKIDLAILRISVYELLNGLVGPSVAIDEAVELAKEFGGESSAKFVNGVLGTVAEKVITNDQPSN